MYKTLLNIETEKLVKADIPYNIEAGYFVLEDMHEAAVIKDALDLAGSIYIIKKIQFQGAFSVNAWTAATKFLRLKSMYNDVDLTGVFEVSQTGNLVTVESEFASVHKVRLKLMYNLAIFIESVAGNIHRASVEYIKINPLNK